MGDGLASHIDLVVITEFLQKLDSIYENADPLSINRGKVHKYLGMAVDFTRAGKVMIYIYDYIKRLI